MIVYLDTSTVLRVLFREAGALAAWSQWRRAYANELLGVEARRVLDRLRLESDLDDRAVAGAHEGLAHIEHGITSIALTRAVLRRAAAPMPTAVKTLDAIHLATALLLQERHEEPVTFATHDVRQRTAARALGFSVIG